MSCGVEGCKFCKPRQKHYCSVCNNTASNHFSRNCFFKNINTERLIQRTKKLLNDDFGSDIIWQDDGYGERDYRIIQENNLYIINDKETGSRLFFKR